tara:strand:+ start:1739 stop:1939 length:201 start_codon:yes stop_codon:yes gene_type:complete
MKTVCYIETDEDGNIEWSEGCVGFTPEGFLYSKELVDREEAEKIIEGLKDKINDMSWSLYPDRMGQ